MTSVKQWKSLISNLVKLSVQYLLKISNADTEYPFDYIDLNFAYETINENNGEELAAYNNNNNRYNTNHIYITESAKKVSTQLKKWKSCLSYFYQTVIKL